MGRTADVFHLPDGNSIPGISLHRVITELCPGLKKIQIIQDTVTISASALYVGRVPTGGCPIFGQAT